MENFSTYEKFESKKSSLKELNLIMLKAVEYENLVKECVESGFNVLLTKRYKDAIDTFDTEIKENRNIQVIISALGMAKDGSDNWEPFINHVRSVDKTRKIFMVIYSMTASNNANTRLHCLDTSGCNMVTNCSSSLIKALDKINLIINDKKGKMKCPLCETGDLSEDGLWLHLPLYHINEDPKVMKSIKKCPKCDKNPAPNLQVHYRNLHGPCGRGEIKSEDYEGVELHAFALVVVHRKEDNKFLLVQEFARSGYWLPGGRVDAGEKLSEAAIRETLEEAGVDVVLKGILTIQFNHSHGRLRIIYYAEPLNKDQKPKSIPDYESVGACYVSAEEIEKLPLRGSEPLKWINQYLLKGGVIYPLEIMSKE